MRGNAGLLSTIINFLIIIFVINLVTKTIKKNKISKQKNNHPNNDNYNQKETQLNMNPGAKDLKHEKTITDKADLTLKRCSNCGGEIPLTMIKCDLCGHRQAGCGVGFIIFILIIIALIGFLFMQGNGISLTVHIHNFMEWLAEL